MNVGLKWYVICNQLLKLAEYDQLYPQEDIDEDIDNGEVLEEQDHEGPEIQSPSANTDLNHSDSIHQSIESILAEEEPDEDVLITIHKLVKQALRVSPPATLKEIMILTAVAGYPQLHQKWQSATGRKHRKPTQAASLAVAHRMGKGPAFACKIWEMVFYVTPF